MATNKGASSPPAVMGSITSDSNGIPTIAKPPPKAPFMKQIRNTPAKVARRVATVRSKACAHFIEGGKWP